MQLKRLFSPLIVKGMTIKNRAIMPAFHLIYTPDGYANDRIKEFYYKRAEGGVGLIITGGFTIDDNAGDTTMCSLKHDGYIQGYKEMTEGIHSRGAKVAAQLFHAGRYVHQSDLPEGKNVLAPSAVISRYTGEIPNAMTTDEINECIKNYAAAALRAKEAGFDAIEITAASGYLISQFLSPVTNLREDEYGGSWENRVRFPLEVIAAVRKAVGSDYPIFMRIAGNDFVSGSNTNENAVEFAKLIDKAGIDMINVTGGWHESRVPQITGELPRAGYAYLSQAVKEAVSAPVIACNRINDPLVAEEVLALGQGDCVGLARALITDPEWVIKAHKGRFEEIRHCVGCNQGCLAKSFFGKPVECLVNGMAGREYEISIRKAANAKKILVVGAGPAGIEFAITAAQCGHEVTVWEKEDKIGGQLNLVKIPPGKEEFGTLIDYQAAMIKKLDIKLELNKEATEQNLLGADFNEIVIAAGAVSNTIKLVNDEGVIDKVTAADVLAGKYIPGRDVVIVGGGSVGCETAQYLAQRGALNKEQLMFLSVHEAESQEKIAELLNNSVRRVSIVEIQKKLGSNFDPGTGWPVFLDLKRLNVAQHTLSVIKAVTSNRVVIEKSGENGIQTIEIPCDTIVLAVGSKSNNELYERVKDKLPNVHNLGDSNRVGKVIDAVQNAIDLAISL